MCSRGECYISEQATSPSPVHPFIESNRVEGTHVYSVDGDHVGTIKRLVIEKGSGQVAYAVTSLGRYFNLEREEDTIPWKRLKYDTGRHGYTVEATEAEVRTTPGFTREDIFRHSTNFTASRRLVFG